MKMYKYRLDLLIGLCFCFFLLMGCEKDKEDILIDNRWDTDVSKNSNIRLINLRGSSQLIVNGDSLTSFILRDRNAPDYYKYPGTKYFPEDGRFGSQWTIPLELFDSSNQAHIIAKSLTYYGLPDYPVELTVKADEQPIDYYLLMAFFVNGMPDYLAVPRSIEAPSKSDHFKLRIVNLAAEITTLEGQGMENLLSPVTLTWADGTPISEKLSNIAPQTYSDYIEIPYGTYQFKVLTSDGRQLPSKPKLGYIMYLDPQTSTMLASQMNTNIHYSSHLTSAPINTFQPGGIYTLVVHPQEFTYYEPQGSDQLNGVQNGFDFINDISEPANINYGRLQLVHALPGTENIYLKINGKTQDDVAVKYAGYTDYIRLIKGYYTVEAVDESGQTLASISFNLDANSNYSLWLHNASGKPDISVVANDLSGSSYSSRGEQDASYNRITRPIYQKLRFLNLNNHYPYITFTANNGQPFSNDASQQLQPGVIPAQEPYLFLSVIGDAFNVMAYRSSPTIMPGEWIDKISALSSSRDMIARPELYIRGLPASEPGVYTIALIGETPDNTAYPARMIVVKHTK